MCEYKFVLTVYVYMYITFMYVCAVFISEGGG